MVEERLTFSASVLISDTLVFPLLTDKYTPFCSSTSLFLAIKIPNIPNAQAFCLSKNPKTQRFYLFPLCCDKTKLFPNCVLLLYRVTCHQLLIGSNNRYLQFYTDYRGIFTNGSNNTFAEAAILVVVGTVRCHDRVKQRMKL